jgi:hypothetical protein
MDKQERDPAESPSAPEVAADQPEGPTDETASPARGPWRFKDFESLWNALERYHFYHEGCRTRGVWVGDGKGYAQGIEMTDQWATIALANQAIDRAMARMRLVDPKLHLLIHHHYRRGLCEQANGWLEAAAKAGMSLSRKEHSARAAFDWILEQAVVLLFSLHLIPHRAWSMMYRTLDR